MATDYQTIYILASGMLLQERKLDVHTNNLANVNTSGFKRDLLTASSWYVPNGVKSPSNSPYEPSNNFVYPIISNINHILQQGTLVHTGNPLDMAIEGEGFFAIRDGNGNIIFTRKGNFRLNSEGYITTEEGYFLLDENMNPIRVEGELKITQDGTIFVNGNPTAKLGVWNLTNIQKLGEDFFTGNYTPSQNFKIYQGFYEVSNVNAVKEIVKIIESVRAHEIFSRLIQMNDEVQGKLNQSI